MPPTDIPITIRPFIGLIMLDLEQITEAYTQLIDRAELVRSVAAGEPACFVFARQRQRRPVSP